MPGWGQGPVWKNGAIQRWKATEAGHTVNTAMVTVVHLMLPVPPGSSLQSRPPPYIPSTPSSLCFITQVPRLYFRGAGATESLGFKLPSPCPICLINLHPGPFHTHPSKHNQKCQHLLHTYAPCLGFSSGHCWATGALNQILRKELQLSLGPTQTRTLTRWASWRSCNYMSLAWLRALQGSTRGKSVLPG